MTPITNHQDTPGVATLEPPNGASRAGAPDKFEAIRAILVGDEFQNFESRFRILETSIDRRQSQFRSELINEFGTMQAKNQSEVKELGEMVTEMIGQLKSEDGAQAQRIEDLGKRLHELEERIGTMTDTVSEQIRGFQDEFSKQMAEFSRLAQSQQDEAARNAISRQDFAEILQGLAGKITAEEAPPAEGHDQG